MFAKPDKATGKDAEDNDHELFGSERKEEVERRAKAAEAHSAEAPPKREELEARHGLDSLVYHIEKMLKEGGDKVDAGDKTEVWRRRWQRLPRRLPGEALPTAEELNAAKEKLTTTSHKFAEAMYKATAAAATPAGGGNRRRRGAEEG